MRFCEEVEEIDRELSAVRGDMEKRRTLSDSLLPWSELDTEIQNIQSTKAVRYLTGMIPEAGLRALRETELEFAAQVYGGSEKSRAVLLACATADYPELQNALKDIEFTDFNFGGLKGTPAQNIDRLMRENDEDQKREAELSERLVKSAVERDLLCRAQDTAVIERDRAAARAALGATGATFVLEGWTRADETENVEAAIQKVTDAYSLELRDPTEDEQVPVVLQNGKLVEPYQAVTKLYAMPVYNSIDATPLFAAYYFIFFGMMLSDTGYGLVLAIACFLLLKLIKPQGMLRQLAGVLLMGGISTVVMGFFCGSFFGVAWPELFAGTSVQNLFPIIDPATEPVKMLVVCAAMGLVHMFFGVGIATYLCFKRKDYLGAFTDNISWFFLIMGVLMLAAPMLGMPQGVATAGKWIAIVSALVILVFAGRDSKSIGGRLAQGAFSLYGITSWLGDVLSYARIFALGLSTGVIGLVLNTLGGMLNSAFQSNAFMQVIGFVLTAAVLVFLHAFMMAITTLGSFVHTARLQYVEFFGKFYEAGGRPFAPLKYNSKFVQVDE